MSSEDLTYAECYRQIMSLASEIIEEAEEDKQELEDLMEKAHEYVDQHEWVIYYYRAHQFVHLLPHEYYDAAEELMGDLHSTDSSGVQVDSFNHHASLMAYHGMTAWLSAEISDRLEQSEKSEADDHAPTET